MRVARLVRKFVEHPLTKLTTGSLLAYAGVSEALKRLEEDVVRQHFDIHHAVALLGLVRVLEVLPEILEGLDRVAILLDGKTESRKR
ncbi:MAG: hypothetical protein AAFY11_04290 [Cyanobacteria bacterium J06641_5]